MTQNAPDYSSIDLSPVSLPYRSEPYIRARFQDPQLAGFEAILIADTAGPQTALSTFVARFPRRVLSEMNTHRVFSRNSASSRARSVRSTVRSVLDEPFIPRFTRNQKGMSGGFVTEDEQAEATQIWLEARDETVKMFMKLLMGPAYDPSKSIDKLMDDYYVYYNDPDSSEQMLSVHKQDANRLLEQFMWHESVITSSFWDNFFALRCDLSAADPSIYAIAVLMRAALHESTPVDSLVHLPFASDEDALTGHESLSDAHEVLMRCATEAAQVSYRDKSTATKSTASAGLGERLLKMNHLSPFEHIAYRADAPALEGLNTDVLSGNLGSDWAQLRKILAED